MRITKKFLGARLKRIVKLTGDNDYYLSWQCGGVALYHKSRDVFNYGHISMRELDMRIEGFIEGYHSRGEKCT